MAINLKFDLSESSNGATDEQSIIAQLDFSNWEFCPEQDKEFNESCERMVRRVVSDAFRNMLQDEFFGPNIEFHSDGINIMVTINLGSAWNDGNIFFIASIEEMIDDFIVCTEPEQMAGGEEARVELAKCLRRCASKLEELDGQRP